MPRILLFLAILLLPHAAFAATGNECRNRTNNELAREQRLYRAYLFGKQKAENAPLNDVRYDKDGWVWIKTSTAGNPWETSHPDGVDFPWTNATMDTQDEHADSLPIKGIFTTKRVMTSELIPYLLQSIRALECRMKMLCTVERYSEIQSGRDPVSIDAIQPAGCKEFTDLTTWPQCHFGGPEKSLLNQADNQNYCEQVSMHLLQREMELLKLAVEYDAGYRTLLQFAGNFDIFLREIRWPLTGTLRQAVGLLGQLERIPCFLSSCEAYPDKR